MDNKEFYLRRQRDRIIKNSLEFTTSRLAWQVTMALSIIFLFAAFDFTVGTFSNVTGMISLVLFVSALFEFIIYKCIISSIVKTGEISNSIRKLGWILIIFAFSGNFFMSISGFMLIKKTKNLEYCLSIYSLLITVIVFVVSSVNLFKEYVADTFMLGMILLFLITICNIVTIFIMAKNVTSTCVKKNLIPLAVFNIGLIITGNLFAFLLGIILLKKIYNKAPEISVEWIDVIRRLFKNYMSVVGLFFISFLVSISLCSYLTFDYELATLNDYQQLLQPPSLMFPFGTDNYGRCTFTRIIFGARISLAVGFVSTMIPILIGGFFGAIAGYYGKRVDNVTMRFLDVLYAIPGLLLAVAIVAAFGASTMNLIMALSVGSIPIYARTVRATVMTLAGQEFVEAAKACGAKNSLIIIKHIIPNSLAPIIVRATLGIGAAVLSTSSLSYLGLGVEPHVPEWGNILKAGSNYIETNPYIAIFPGLAIILIVLAFNYFGDGLRDALDPKLK